jgi:hypothetical protein
MLTIKNTLDCAGNINIPEITTVVLGPTLRIAGSKKHSDEERGAPLFAVRVNAIVSHNHHLPLFRLSSELQSNLVSSFRRVP